MLKKVLLGIFLSIAVIAFTFNYAFANDMQNAANHVKNAVGAAENTVENAARGISNTSKEVTGDMQNTASDVTGTQNNDRAGNAENNNAMIGMTGSDTGNYTASRTATTNNNATLLGMNSTTWIWLIMAISAVAIVSLIYYYSASATGKHGYNHEDGE